MSKLHVMLDMDTTYKVYVWHPDGYPDVLFLGSLCECEAWIRLVEGGYIDVEIPDYGR